MESSADIGLHMCVHIIPRYDDTMKERGVGGGRGKKGIHIYIIYRVDSLLSAGVVSRRQHALLLYARAYYTCPYPCTHTYIYKCIPS